MPDPTLRERADERFTRALEASGYTDPRDLYRARLRELRARDQSSYDRAVEYFQSRLLPAVAADGSDPVAEWIEYGRLLAQLGTDGATAQVDPTGRSLPYSPPVPPDHLVLHLPDAPRERALVVALPADPSPAQRATLDLLVEGSLG